MNDVHSVVLSQSLAHYSIFKKKVHGLTFNKAALSQSSNSSVFVLS